MDGLMNQQWAIRAIEQGALAMRQLAEAARAPAGTDISEEIGMAELAAQRLDRVREGLPGG
jgi:hypothetical protein